MSILTSLASRFVAGETGSDAVRVVRALNDQGARATLNYLGEDVTSREQAEAARDEYRRLLKRINLGGVDANVSVKLTQLGLALDPALCRDNLEAVLEEAARGGNFVRLDMEGSAYTQKTLDLFFDVFSRRANCGVVIQAGLRRSEGDIAALLAKGARVRLCKGAYKEPAALAYQEREEVSESYDRLAEALLTGGPQPAFATHDEERILRIQEAARRLGISSGRYEFQMLYGLREGLRAQLIAAGHRLRVYVPYGPQCVGYMLRRLRERKENFNFAVAGLLHN